MLGAQATSRIGRFCSGVSWLLVLGSPFVTYFAVTRARLADAALLLLAFAVFRTLPVILSARREHVWAALRLPIVAVVSAGASVVTGEPRALLVLPSLSQAAFAGVFFSSLRSTPLVEHFARMQKPNLTAEQVRYCRSVTVVWGVILTLASAFGLVLAVWAPIAVWTAFTAVGCYVLIAAVFSIEYVVRKIRFREYGRMPVDWMLSKIFPPASPKPEAAAPHDERSLELRASDDGRVEAQIPRDYVFFRGHFDGAPMLPGVVQLAELVLPVARSRHPEIGALRKLRRVRFRRPIFPGETVTVGLATVDRSPLELQFELRVGDTLVASGSMTFDAAGHP
jgi:uncharacterized membrane protein/3-hydroxymyristoyl/3-hydroxydecanoyl-(acyl carrier protein) dehydratase